MSIRDLHDFFGASVGAAAALTGLLFVAITLAPEKIFGPGAEAKRRGDATGSFIALGNIFFVSLGGLIPTSEGWVAISMAGVSMFQTVRESIAMSRLFPELRGFKAFGLTGCLIYGLELGFAIRFTAHLGTAEGLVWTIFGLYAYALATSWRLLRARDIA